MTTSDLKKIDLLLLGLLLDRPMHGYELYQQIQEEGIDAWFHVSMAGIYYSLGKLHEQGLAAESRQPGGRSRRKSIYRLTAEGRTSFFEAMETHAIGHEPVHLDYDVVIYFLNKLPVQRAAALLEDRLAWLAGEVAGVDRTLEQEKKSNGSSRRQAVLEHKRRYLEMERSWLADVLSDIDAGAASGATSRMRGLMTLTGELRHYHLPDLIRLIVSGQLSGMLSLDDGVRRRTIVFREGRPERAMAEPDSPISDEVMLDAVLDLFRWQEGVFAFNQGLTRETGGTPLDLKAEELILRGCRWVDNWDTIQRLVPSTDAVFEQAARPGDSGSDLPLNEGEAEVLAAVDGSRDVARLARDLGLTVFEASRALYCLAATGLVRIADLDKIRLRRVFREIAELMCSSTEAWRTAPEDQTCEEEVNAQVGDLPLCLNAGRIEDRVEPNQRIDALVEVYQRFLLTQLEVVSRRFGRENARRSLQRTLRQLAPELQDVARRYGFDRLLQAWNSLPPTGTL